jgi:hypothetical protein
MLGNGRNVYLFLETTSFGYRSSYLGYSREAITAFFNVPVPPSDKRSDAAILEITPTELKHYELGSLSLGLRIIPLDNIIYADTDKGLQKWTGTRFESMNAEDQQRFLNRPEIGLDFSDFNGWSKQSLIFNKGVDARLFDEGGNVKFDIQLDGKPATLVVTHGKRNNFLSLSLERQGQVAQKIWYIDHRPSKVTQSEYMQAFAQHE